MLTQKLVLGNGLYSPRCAQDLSQMKWGNSANILILQDAKISHTWKVQPRWTFKIIVAFNRVVTAEKEKSGSSYAADCKESGVWLIASQSRIQRRIFNPSCVINIVLILNFYYGKEKVVRQRKLKPIWFPDKVILPHYIIFSAIFFIGTHLLL